MGGNINRILLGLVLPEAVPVMYKHESDQKKAANALEERQAIRANQRSLGALYGGVQGTIGTSNVGVPEQANTNRVTLLGR